jgi:hypothetical protein
MMSEDPFNLDFAELMKAIDNNMRVSDMFVCSQYCTLGFVNIFLFINVNKFFYKISQKQS